MAIKKMLVTLFLVWIQLVAALQPQDNEASLEGPRGLKVFVGRRGGTIRLYRQLPPRPPPPPKDEQQKKHDSKKPRRSGEITLSFGRIQEVDSSSNAITGSHGVKKPNNVDFTVTDEMDRAVQRAGAGVSEIRGDCLDCRSSLKDANNAAMTLTVCVVKTNATLMLGDEQAPVSSGQLKFSVKLERWPWANNGKHIDVDIIMKVPRGRQIRKKSRTETGRPVAFELGADASAYFPTKVDADGGWNDMEDGYPKFDNKGADNIITLRVPRFSNYVIYDPTIEAGYEDGSSVLHASVLATCLAVISFVVLVYY